MQGIIPALLIVGLLTITGYYFGQAARRIKLPSIIGFMIVGVILGPSVLNVIDRAMEERLAFLAQVALGFVALSIGLELRFSWLRKQGAGIIVTILGQCFGAFVAVMLAVYAVGKFFGIPEQLTGSGQFIVLALVFGALATATAPAATMAVIREYRAKGNLTRTLYAVVGYDDALAVIIYGFAAAIARNFLLGETGGGSPHILLTLLVPLWEVLESVIVGAGIGVLFCVLARKLKRPPDMFVLITGFILAANGLSAVLHLSFILTNMIFGFVVVNTQPHSLIQRIRSDLDVIMPLLFIFLFGLAGANLEISLLPNLGLLGVVYIVSRSAGKILGAGISATAGGLEEKIKKYLGLGLLSQAGVAVGLALIARHELRGIGMPVAVSSGETVTSGDAIGSVVLTTIMATCIVFEIIGPILVKIALGKAGEISPNRESEQ